MEMLKRIKQKNLSIENFEKDQEKNFKIFITYCKLSKVS